MRILHLNKYWYPRGGADRYALWLASAQQARGHTVRVLTVAHPRNEHTGVPVVEISAVQTERVRGLDAPRTLGRMLWSLEAMRALRGLLARESFDVAHIHNIYTQISPSVLPVLKAAGIPVVAHVHDYGMISANHALYDKFGIDRDGGFWRVLTRRGIKDSFAASAAGAAVFALHRHFRMYERHVDRLIFTSQFVQRLFASKGWEGDRGVVIPYVVDVGAEARRPHEDRGYFFFGGWLHELKGVHVLVEAARATGLCVKVAGDGPARALLQKQVGAMTNVEFLGPLAHEQVLSYMRQATAVVVPSLWWEPFGMVAIEAQGLGTPVIASRTGGLAELVIHGMTGLLVTSGDVTELASAMRRLAGDSAAAAHMGALAKRRFQTQYSVSRHLEHIETVYRDAMSLKH